VINMAQRLQELMTTTTEPEMIPSQIYNTVIEAVKDKLIGTNLLALRIGSDGIPGSSVDVVTQDVNSMTVSTLAEGQEVPISTEAVSTFNLKPVKYGMRPLITKEMIEDNKWDIIQRNLTESGYAMARKLDSLIMAQIEAGNSAASHTVSGGAAITLANIVTGMYNLEYDGYTPSDFVISAAIAQDIRQINTFVEADKAGITNPSKSLIGTIYGMRVWQTNMVTADYAYIIDKDHALLLAEKRPITVEKYNDVTRDLSGVVLTARWVARYLRANACCVIQCS
jgi:HK97 family phage major capsid protein